MHFIKKIIITSFFILQNTAFAVPPIPNCNMNGDWYLAGNPQVRFHYDQMPVLEDIMVVGNSIDPICSRVLMSVGFINSSNEVSFWVAGAQTANCDYLHYVVKANFTSLCAEQKWHITLDDGTTQEQTFLRVPIKIVAPDDKELIISSEPRMPNFVAKVELDNPVGLNKMYPVIPKYTWGIRIKHDIGADFHANAYLDNVAGANGTYQPNFNLLKEVQKDGSIVEVPGGVVGGELTLSVEYYQNLHVEKKYSILKGTNPGQAAIEQVITDPTLRQIACQESRYKQFYASREGGVGKLNTKDGSRGGVGVMQLYDPMPTSAQVWSWRENIKAGIDLYNTKRIFALQHPNIEFKNLNKEREKLGLPACTKELPPLTPEQLSREIIRLYNCGFEYRWEPRDAPNCEGQWVVSPSCAITNPKAYDKEYVDKVLKCDINHYR